MTKCLCTVTRVVWDKTLFPQLLNNLIIFLLIIKVFDSFNKSWKK